jgi:hypothetical protein
MSMNFYPWVRLWIRISTRSHFVGGWVIALPGPLPSLLIIASFVPPHFWTETVSIATYLINIQLSSTLQDSIPFECLCGKTLDYFSLRLFGYVCYVLLAPRERTKLTA